MLGYKYNYMYKIFSFILGDDLYDIPYCYNLFNKSSVLKKINNLEPDKQVFFLFITINTAIFIYKIKIGFFTKLLTLTSGRKILSMILNENPIYALVFYLSFYFKYMSETDRTIFNLFTSSLGLPEQRTIINTGIIENFVTSFTKYIFQYYKIEINKKTEEIILKFLTIKVYNTIIGQVVYKSPQITLAIYDRLFRKSIQEIDHYEAVQIPMTVDNQLLISKWLDYIKNIKKPSEKKINEKIVCLEECKPKTRVARNCYCESECKNGWCYVDRKKCRNKNILESSIFSGSYWAKCDPKREKEKKCWSGRRYLSCKQV